MSGDRELGDRTSQMPSEGESKITNPKSKIRHVAIVVAVIGISVTTFVLRDRWLRSEPTTAEAVESATPIEDAKVLKLSPQVRKNLGLVSKPTGERSKCR